MLLELGNIWKNYRLAIREWRDKEEKGWTWTHNQKTDEWKGKSVFPLFDICHSCTKQTHAWIRTHPIVFSKNKSCSNTKSIRQNWTSQTQSGSAVTGVHPWNWDTRSWGAFIFVHLIISNLWAVNKNLWNACTVYGNDMRRKASCVPLKSVRLVLWEWSDMQNHRCNFDSISPYTLGLYNRFIGLW